MVAPITLWRIAKDTSRYPAADMGGAGAAAEGARWNSKGVYVTYSATSIALATLETLAHLSDSIAARNRFLIKITVPMVVWKKRVTTEVASLPKTWLAEPPGKSSTDCGDAWLASKVSALLMVPSVIVHEEFNVLINPAHPDIKKITAEVVRQFVYDPRLK